MAYVYHAWYALCQGMVNQHVLLTYSALEDYFASILALFFPITSFAGLGAMLIFAHVLSGYISSSAYYLLASHAGDVSAPSSMKQ
jgi:hypothetical protein